jgi:predicted subunit of tRNA(5-methylaminomethyl-2-thiouridylate) methyltransferase
MRKRQYTFNFKGGSITVWAFGYEEAKILAQAEAISKGWDFKIIEEKGEVIENAVELILIDKVLMAIIEMEDADTFDEQLDCIEALKKLRTKLKHKEATK